MKEKRKLRDRLALKMILPGDVHDHETTTGGRNDQGLFDLEKIKTKKVKINFEPKKKRKTFFILAIDGNRFSLARSQFRW